MSQPQVRLRPRRGVYEGPFWDYVETGEIRLQKCTGCGRFRYPPGPVCPVCLSQDSDWTPVRGTGRVQSWVTFHRQYFEHLPVPYTVVAAELAEGPILIANLVGAGPEELSLDLPVRLVFEPASDIDGTVWQIYQWAIDTDPAA